MKYEKLDKYLTEREKALDLCRDEVKAVKAMNQQLRCEKETLENEKFEQRSTIERMEKQHRSFSMPPKEDTALVKANNELKCKYDALVSENDSIKVCPFLCTFLYSSMYFNINSTDFEALEGGPF